MKIFMVLFCFYLCHTPALVWANGGAPDGTRNSGEVLEGETWEPGEIWDPGNSGATSSPGIPESAAEDFIRKPRGKRGGSGWPQPEGDYANCISGKQGAGIPYGQALEECKHLKGGNGDVEDYLKNIPLPGQRAQKMNIQYMSADGQIREREISIEAYQQMLTELGYKRLRIQENDSEVAVVRVYLGNVEVLERVPKRIWTQLMAQNQTATLAASAAHRGKIRQLGSAIKNKAGKGFKALLKKIPGAGFVSGTRAFAGDHCSRYDSYYGVDYFLSLGRKDQLAEAKRCPAAAGQSIQLFLKY